MQNIHELNAEIDRLKKLFGADKPSPTRVKGLIKQLGDNSLLAIGTVVPPIRQDEIELNTKLSKTKKQQPKQKKSKPIKERKL